ncbi:uncharacterized protein [Anoplolepis gracilipes]|uniref:uncharacterized protein n=1 Tax=Anoplolepis gracilipes TaxID=354296 RepID=UPI003BA02E49
MASKSKHYTSIEKNLFLQILQKYKHVIECKKSKHDTLREKEVAWSKICREFNNSSLVMQKRNMQQLKKLWANLKQTQKDILTKERQARFDTEEKEILVTEIDPDVALTASDFMSTAPVLFTSNMNDDEIKDQKQLLQEMCRQNNIETLKTDKTTNNKISLETNNDISLEANALNSKEIIADMLIGNSKDTKKQKLVETEDDLKNLRIKNIIEQERQLAEVKLQHEKTMTILKEMHLREINKLELRIYLAKAKLAEVLLEKEKDNV